MNEWEVPEEYEKVIVLDDYEVCTPKNTKVGDIVYQLRNQEQPYGSNDKMREAFAVMEPIEVFAKDRDKIRGELWGDVWSWSYENLGKLKKGRKGYR